MSLNRGPTCHRTVRWVRDWLSANQGPVFPDPVGSCTVRNRPIQVNNQSELVISSRDWTVTKPDQRNIVLPGGAAAADKGTPSKAAARWFLRMRLSCGSSESNCGRDVSGTREYSLVSVATLRSLSWCCCKNGKTRLQVTGGVFDNCNTLFQTTQDVTLHLNIIHILEHIAAASGNKATRLVRQGAPHALLRSIASTSRVRPLYEELCLHQHLLLIKLAAKEKKLALKARLCGVVAITLDLAKQCLNNMDISSPLLQVLRIYAGNSSNAASMVKNGVLTLLDKYFSMYGKQNNAVFRYSLDLQSQILSYKSNASKAACNGSTRKKEIGTNLSEHWPDPILISEPARTAENVGSVCVLDGIGQTPQICAHPEIHPDLYQVSRYHGNGQKGPHQVWRNPDSVCLC
eukprot:sb/3465311/